VRGETVIVCHELKLLFMGDLFVNVAGLTEHQREFEELQPSLMANVDANPALAAQCRAQLLADFPGYTICPGRGPIIG
jgi:hypothetical protein